MRKLNGSMLACSIAAVGGLVLGIVSAVAQQPAAAEGKKAKAPKAPPAMTSPLLFHVEFKQPATPGERPIMPSDVAADNVEMRIYGDAKNVMLSGSVPGEGVPLSIWTGTTLGPMAVTFRDKNNFIDLTPLGKIRWTTRMTGFHVIRPIVKLADGTWLIGDVTSGSWGDFNESEISFNQTRPDIRWLGLDIDRVVTKGFWVDKVDLTKVDEIGFADLMPGSGHGPGGSSLLTKMDVFGKPVKR